MKHINILVNYITYKLQSDYKNNNEDNNTIIITLNIIQNDTQLGDTNKTDNY